MARWLDGFIDGTLERLGYAKAARATPAMAILGGEAPLFQQPVADTDEATARLAMTSAWLYSDVQLIANEAARARVRVLRRDGEEWVEEYDHPFEQLMMVPNRNRDQGSADAHAGMSGQFMRRYTFWWWLLRGEAYWLIVRDAGGELAELWPLPSSRMEPIPDPLRYIAGYWYSPRQGGQPVRLDTAEVAFFRFPNPFDFHRGLSPLSAAKLALETDLEAARWNQRTFKEDVTLRTLISLPQGLSRMEFSERKAELLEQLIERQRRFLVVRAGDIDAEALSLGAKDMEYMAGRAFTREELDRIYGVPAGFWAKEATRANSDAAKSVLIDMTVWPLLSLMADEITAQIVQPAYGDEYRVEFEDVRPTDRLLVMQEREKYWQVQTVDEARAELGLEPLPDATLGATLVPLATRAAPAPVQPGPVPASAGMTAGVTAEALAGLGPGKSLGGLTYPPGAKTLPLVLAPQAREDLRRWRGIALRRVKAGEAAAGYAFESDALPDTIKASVTKALAGASTEEEVRAAFAAGFRGAQGDWQAYP